MRAYGVRRTATLRASAAGRRDRSLVGHAAGDGVAEPVAARRRGTRPSRRSRSVRRRARSTARRDRAVVARRAHRDVGASITSGLSSVASSQSRPGSRGARTPRPRSRRRRDIIGGLGEPHDSPRDRCATRRWLRRPSPEGRHTPRSRERVSTSVMSSSAPTRGEDAGGLAVGEQERLDRIGPRRRDRLPSVRTAIRADRPIELRRHGDDAVGVEYRVPVVEPLETPVEIARDSGAPGLRGSARALAMLRSLTATSTAKTSGLGSAR